MDFLNKLKHDEEKDSYENSSTQTEQQGKGEKLMNMLGNLKKHDNYGPSKTEHSATSHSEGQGEHGEGRNLLEQLIAGTGSDSHHQEDGAAAHGSHTKKEEGDNPSFFDKLTGKAEREEEERRRREEQERLERERERREHPAHYVFNELTGHGRDNNGQSGEGDKPSFLDKLTGKADEEERRRKEEEQKSTLEKMKDRLNEQMGGGQKAEKEEDLLDKTIDVVQEHILKQGKQNDESAWEQMKDDKIADAIRKQLNLKEKGDE